MISRVLGMTTNVDFCWFIQRNYDLIQDELDIGSRIGIDAGFITNVHNLIEQLSEETKEICVLNNIKYNI